MSDLAHSATPTNNARGASRAVQAALEAMEEVGDVFSVVGDIFGFVDMFFDPNAEVMNELHKIEGQISNLRQDMR
jgi:hypothetical protein